VIGDWVNLHTSLLFSPRSGNLIQPNGNALGHLHGYALNRRAGNPVSCTPKIIGEREKSER